LAGNVDCCKLLSYNWLDGFLLRQSFFSKATKGESYEGQWLRRAGTYVVFNKKIHFFSFFCDFSHFFAFFGVFFRFLSFFCHFLRFLTIFEHFWFFQQRRLAGDG
jgi:hypothetical protein